MANTDEPGKNGICGALLGAHAYPLAASQSIKYGDLVTQASGLVQIATATSNKLLGMALENVTSGGSPSRTADTLLVADDPDQEFYLQTSGTLGATHVGANVDMEGTTGAHEVDEDASTYGVIAVVREDYDQTLAANARVRCKIAHGKHINRD